MKCKNCKYLVEERGWFTGTSCKISNRVNPISCDISNDEDVENMDICYNCQHWIGGGDWGLSCAKNYYNCNCDGFVKSCDQFERRAVVHIEYDD